MSANLITFRPTGIRVCSVPDRPKPDPGRPRSSSSPNWWSPIFGLSSDPDYIGTERKAEELDDKKESGLQSNPDPKAVRSRFAPGCFTEDKAKQLRMLTKGTSSFHDVMYHSAIASRLASDFNYRPDP